MNKKEKKQIKKQAEKDFNKQFNWNAPLYGEDYISLETDEYAKNKHKTVYFMSQPIKRNE